jgi:DNA polymerase-1
MTEEHRTPTLRSCIVASSCYTFLSLDAAQIELKVAAFLSQDPALIQDATSSDMHLATALRIFADKIEEEQIQPGTEQMKNLRYQAKQINFAILYGAEAYKIAEMSDGALTEDEAEELITRYFLAYPVLKHYMDTRLAQAKLDGYVVNQFERIRHLPELKSSIYKIRQKAEREVFNTLVQGTAVDLVKLCMLHLRSRLDKSVRMVLQVHDEILFEVPDTLLRQAIIISKELAVVMPLYPFHVSVGKCYGELHEMTQEELNGY